MSTAKQTPAAAAAAASSSAVVGSAPLQQRPARVRSNELVLFDIETNIFPIEIIEFGAIIVDKFSYIELDRVHTLIQPASGAISSKATKIHGISFEHVRHAPFFAAIAARVFDALDGRVWIGHNINSFDTPHILKAFEAAGVAAPKPSATLDTLPLIRRIFGKRAGDCKMATLGLYFNLGVEKHRAVDDCEMTLQALKCIALHNLLEREMPETFPKFEEAPKAAAAPAAAAAAPAAAVIAAPAAAAAASAPVDAVDALSAQLQSTAIDGAEKKPAAAAAKKPKAKKQNAAGAAAVAAGAANEGGFIDSSLIGGAAPAATTVAASASAPVAAAPAAAAVHIAAPSVPAASAAAAPAASAAVVDEWQVSISKKTIKQEKAHKEAAAAAAAKKALLAQQKKEFAKQAQLKAQQAQAQARAAPSASAASSQSAPSSQESNGSASGAGNSWSKLVKSGSSQLSAAAPTFTPSASPKLGPAASPPAASAAPAPAAAPAKSPSAGPASAPSGPKSKPPPFVLNPADLLALHSALDHYVANPSFACKLAYNGGSQPGSIRVIRSVSWLHRPTHFRAVIHQNRHGEEPVTFRTDQCISIERIEQL